MQFMAEIGGGLYYSQRLVMDAWAISFEGLIIRRHREAVHSTTHHPKTKTSFVFYMFSVLFGVVVVAVVAVVVVVVVVVAPWQAYGRKPRKTIIEGLKYAQCKFLRCRLLVVVVVVRSSGLWRWWW